MSPHRLAAGGLAAALAAVLATGCAYTTAPPSAGEQLVERVRGAYGRTTALPAVSAAVTETVQSGTSPVAQGTGTVTWEFARKTGETRLTVDGRTPVVAVRVKDTFYEARTRASLAGTGRDLVRDGGRDAKALPQIQAPGLDPFQLTTLLDATSWPDSLVSAQPVVTSDADGRHTEYQLGVDTAKLAAHAPAGDKAWLTEMSRRPGGATVTVVVTLAHGRIATLAARLPVPGPPSAAKAATGASALPTPKSMSILVSARFDYATKPDRITPPA
ncbi:hypothetical protein AB0E27_06470 [Streptomyces sparsogenes]|uniref:hypothetical protein n=1 Tax=Streptomyces sparsogenes TaxID=67365 RepID=UPI00340149C2